MAEKLKGDQKGGILDLLVNKGTLPEVKVSLSNETFISLGITIVVSSIIIVLVNYLMKLISK